MPRRAPRDGPPLNARRPKPRRLARARGEEVEEADDAFEEPAPAEDKPAEEDAGGAEEEE